MEKITEKPHLHLVFSNRKNGTTNNMANTEMVKERGDIIMYVDKVHGCVACDGCSIDGVCIHIRNTMFMSIMEDYEDIHFYTPVHVNMPTPKLMTLLGTMSTVSENFHNKEMFNGHNAHIHVITDVSGSQATASALMSALNMVGFTLPPRCVKSYVRNWQDNKIRGGSKADVKYMEEEVFLTTGEKNK